MKKTLMICLAILILSGCSIKKEILTTEKTITPEIEPTSSYNPQYTAKEYFGGKRLEKQFEMIGLPAPSSINLFIGETEDYIGFTYQFGYNLTEEDLKIKDTLICDEFKNIYIYYGQIKKLSENIYSCNGNYIPSLKQYENIIAEDIDFYIIEKNDKLYLIYDDLSLDDLQNYISDSYAVFHGSVSNEIFFRYKELE